MKSLLSTVAIAALALMAPLAALADDSKPKFSITPTGRVLFDGAVYMPDGDGFADGVSIPDIRMGLKASYGNWSGKIDVGYSFGKLGLKDVYMQYSFNKENLLRLGYFVHQFGLNAATSSSMKPAMEAPIPDTYFAATGRNMGLMYVMDKPKTFWGVSAMVAGNSLTTRTNDQGKISGGAITRFVYRPNTTDGVVTQFGISGWYQTALHKLTTNDAGDKVTSPGYFGYSAGFPTRVASVSMLGADINDASGVIKISPEIVLAKSRVALEGQYYYMNVLRRHDRASYQAHGGYAHLRCLLAGDREYGYASADAGLATPGKGTLEMVAGWNYTDGNAGRSGIKGGKGSDYSLTLNYYINKYVLARLRYSYTDVNDSPVQRNRNVHTIQARLQIKF